uniref:Uncharacterized protein n=1 Tax=Oryza punctata TaxID=4537 RepID=A0A0E0JK96_ORYPU
MVSAKRDHTALDFADNDDGDRGCTACSDDFLSCVVCTEPLEWMAVGPCGLRVRGRRPLRTQPGPLTYSPIVVVTNAAIAHSLFTFSESSMPVATQDDDGQVYWYSAAMSAYFDDKKHYDQVTKQVVADHRFLRTPPRPPLRSDEDASSLHRLCVRMSWRGHVLAVLIVVLVSALIGGSVGYLTTRHEVTSDRIGIVIGLAALYAAVAAVVYGIVAVFHR